ncbi:MAG: LamG domain-containing protein [Fibrobacter sp.]|nr:LamG domain-containing protein [Fibrobacter sp.]
MRLGFGFSAITALLVAGCSRTVSGNSAETGSPELAGVLYLNDGAPAKYARVRVVGSQFDYYHGNDLDDVIEVTADSNGAYAIDSLPGMRSFSLEAFHEETGKRLLVRNLTREDSLVVSDSLQNPGTALLNVENVLEDVVDGLSGEATIVGTTFLQPVKVKNGVVKVDSLPAGEQDLIIHLFEKDTLDAAFRELNVTPGDTIVDTIPEAVIRAFKAPLALPEEDAFDSAYSSITDVPMAMRIDGSLDGFDGLAAKGKGRFEAYRINKEGVRSASLPISIGRLDSSAREAVFWVRVDSLNFTDSILIEFNSIKPAIYATDVFRTIGHFRTVWHFDSGVDSFEDVAENEEISTGTPYNVEEIDGAVGKAFHFDGAKTTSVVVDNSVSGELNFPADTLSYSVWVRIDDIKDSSMIFSKDGQYSLVYDPAAGFIAGFRETVGDSNYAHTFRSGDSLAVEGKWTHIYFLNRSGKQSFYVDGNLIPQKNTKASTSHKRYETSLLVIGRSFNGAIDELFFSDGPHSDSWVKVLYLNQNPEKIWPKFVDN